MKKLALLQLLLLPLAGLADVTSASEGKPSAQCECVEKQADTESIWQSGETVLEDVAKRLVGPAYAAGIQHAHGVVRVGR